MDVANDVNSLYKCVLHCCFTLGGGGGGGGRCICEGGLICMIKSTSCGQLHLYSSTVNSCGFTCAGQIWIK